MRSHLHSTYNAQHRVDTSTRIVLALHKIMRDFCACQDKVSGSTPLHTVWLQSHDCILVLARTQFLYFIFHPVHSSGSDSQISPFPSLSISHRSNFPSIPYPHKVMVCPEVLSGCQRYIQYIDIHSIDIPYQVIAGIVQSTSIQRLD